MDRWKIDKTTRFFIDCILDKDLDDKDSKILAFRRHWELGDEGLENKKLLPDWKKKIKNRCLASEEETKVSELEVYFEKADSNSPDAVLSSVVEKRIIKEIWIEDKLTEEEKLEYKIVSVFALAVRSLGYELKIPAEFDRFLEYFLIHNERHYNLILNRGITIGVRYRFNEKYGQLGENVYLILGENTSSEDFDRFWNNKVKPYLLNLPARIKGLKKLGKNTEILKEILNEKEDKNSWASFYTDHVNKKKTRIGDREIIIDKMTDRQLDKLYSAKDPTKAKEIDRKINTSLNRKIHNERYYRSKRKPL